MAARLAGLAAEIDAALTSGDVSVVEGQYMLALGQAFAEIQSGVAAKYTVSDGHREYLADRFSIIVKE
jgi:hypothetical protein